MRRPLLNLTAQTNWEGVIRQTFSIAPLPKKKPISPFSRTVNSNVLVIGCRSDKAKPTWRLGLNLAVSVSASPHAFSGLSGQMAFYQQEINLDLPTLVHFPAYEPKPYQVHFSTPYWIKQIYVEVWQYTGPQSSTIEETLGEILREVRQ